MTRPDLQAASADVHADTPESWYVGPPMEHPERGQWAMFAFDTTRTPVEGKRAVEWTTVARTEREVVWSMAYCLRDLGEGRWPRWLSAPDGVAT